MKRSWWQVLVGVVGIVAGVGLIIGAFGLWDGAFGVLGLLLFMAGVSLVARQGFRPDQQEQEYQRSKAAHQAPPPPFPPTR